VPLQAAVDEDQRLGADREAVRLFQLLGDENVQVSSSRRKTIPFAVCGR
jgi:hypothetical protein